MSVYAVSGLGQDKPKGILDTIEDAAGGALTQLRKRGEYELQKKLCEETGRSFFVDREGTYRCEEMMQGGRAPQAIYPVKQRSQTHLYLIGAAVIGVALFAIARMRG